jgi:large subunit ribosomal protein L30
VSGQLKITLRRSRIGTTPRQREVLSGLGLRRMHATVIRPDHPAIRGMVAKVSHLVEVEVRTGPSGGEQGSNQHETA